MRFTIRVAFMPCPVAGDVHPISHQPDFIRHVLRAENIHADKACATVDEVRAENERFLNLSIHIVSHDEPAEDTNRLLFQWSNSSRKGLLFKSTPTTATVLPLPLHRHVIRQPLAPRL